jgi:hypothetical protein
MRVRFSVLLLGLLAPLGLFAASPPPRLLTDQPVPVTLTVEQTPEGENAVFHIGGDDPAARVKTLYNPDLAQDFGSHLTWTPPYLLVRSVSGGNCWDCTGVAIFKIENGTVRRLGDINTDFSPEFAPPAAPGHFITGYSKLEIQTGFCHACAPFFLVGLADRGTSLEIDGEGTWALNRELWQRVANTPPEVPPENDEDASWQWRDEGFRDLVSAAALARFCGREQDLATLQARWATVLDQDARDRMAEALATVKPLEPVTAWNAMAPY